jgi:hypothetical protein
MKFSIYFLYHLFVFHQFFFNVQKNNSHERTNERKKSIYKLTNKPIYHATLKLGLNLYLFNALLGEIGFFDCLNSLIIGVSGWTAGRFYYYYYRETNLLVFFSLHYLYYILFF